MIPSLQYQDPIIISHGGIYSGNFRSTDGSPAIIINTGDPVEIKNSVIVGNGQYLIHQYGYGDVNIHNNDFYSDSPVPGVMRARVINSFRPLGFIFENNYAEHTGGMIIEKGDDSGRTKKSIRISRNKFLNIDKRRADGGVDGHVAGIMLKDLEGFPEIRVSWNEIINRPNESWIEDNINIYMSRGTSQNPILIHDNYIYGAFPIPAHAGGFSGSGITIDGSGQDANTIPQYINAYNNQIVKCSNACMNIATGNNNHFYNNRMIHYAYLDDGSYIEGSWAGCCIFNGSNLPPSLFNNNTIQSNTIGYQRLGINYKYENRQDEMTNRGVNFMPPDNNTYLPNPITKATEDNESSLWLQKLVLNGVSIGNTTIPKVKRISGRKIIKL